MNRSHDIGGRFLGIPYDWRWPTLRKIKGRIWDPGGPVFPPKVFGWGYTMNLANPKSWALLAGVFALASLAVGLG